MKEDSPVISDLLIPRERVLFCGIIATLLHEDGSIEAGERRFLEELMSEFRLSAHQREEVWAYAVAPSSAPRDIERLRRAGVADALMQRLHQAAHADGVFHPSEAKMISEIDHVIRWRLGAQEYPVELAGLAHEPIKERYEVLETLGEGGFGQVFLAVERGTGRRVALKRLHLKVDERLASSLRAEVEDRFWREVAILGSLQSPHSVRLLGAGFDVRTPYMVLEYLEGRTFEALIAAEAPLPEDRVYRLLWQSLHAVAEAHSKGIVHRDLKPANIFLTGEGVFERVRVLDYGLAGVVEGFESSGHVMLTLAGQVVGTPSYMPAEQLLEAKVKRPQSDVYSLGLIFLECLTGERAAQGESKRELFRWLVSAEPVLISAEVLETPLGQVLQRACSKNWMQRYPSAVEMLAAVEAALAPEEAPARRGFMNRLWRGISQVFGGASEPNAS